MTMPVDLPEPLSMAARKMRLRQLQVRLQQARFAPRYGRVLEVRPPVLRAALKNSKVGDICLITSTGGTSVRAEVISQDQTSAILSPIGSAVGLAVGDRIQRLGTSLNFEFSEDLLGRVLDGLGNVISSGVVAGPFESRPARRAGPGALQRPLITNPLETGIRAIDGMLTLGRGQRMALLGPPGSGKSSLLAQVAVHSDVDVVVIGLIGERGREVQEFLSRQLPADKRGRMVVVAATSDRPAMERAYAADIATAVAEGFRDRGRSVLLMIDSMTRVARALREIGLAAGEIPVRRGYPPSIYEALPKLVERAGLTDMGEITAIYTVLLEGDSADDPLAEEMRSLTDGHLELSSALAERGHFPAIDVIKSVSRVMTHLVPEAHASDALTARGLLAKFEEIRLLVQIGEYEPGQDAEADKAIEKEGKITAFLRQRSDHRQTLDQTVADLKRCLK